MWHKNHCETEGTKQGERKIGMWKATISPEKRKKIRRSVSFFLSLLLILEMVSGTGMFAEWKNIIVSDESLTRYIYSLRCIFEKIGYDRCIETIYRKGYRFSGQVFKTKINEDNTSDYSIAIFPFTTSLNTLDPLILNQELVQIISNKKIDGLYTYPMAATNFCNDHISQNSFLSRFKPDYFVTGRINQNNAVNTLYIELIDAKNLFLIASNHLPVDELHNTSQFIIDNILQTVHKPEDKTS